MIENIAKHTHFF